MDIDELLAALDEYRDALEEYRQCCDKCYYDADYWCYRQSKACHEAKARLGAAFDAYIDERIAKAAECRQKEPT